MQSGRHRSCPEKEASQLSTVCSRLDTSSLCRLQKLTEEYEKVQERLHQAHRRASKQDPDHESLESVLSGPSSNAAESPAAAKAPASAHESALQSVQPGTSKQVEAEVSPAVAGGVSTMGAATSVLHQADALRHPADDFRVAEVAKNKSPADEGQNGASSPDVDVPHEDGVHERSAAQGTDDVVGAVAVRGTEEGLDSGRSSGNEKLPSDWSVVSPTANANGNGNTAAGSPQQKTQAQHPDVQIDEVKAATVPDGAESRVLVPAEKSTEEEKPSKVEAGEGDEGEEEEDVDFDDLQDGEGGDEEGGEEELDDNWGWE
jgi:hypothetical protein